MPSFSRIREKPEPYDSRRNPQPARTEERQRLPTHSPLRGASQSRKIFAFQKETIEQINQVKSKRNLTPQTNRVTFNPRNQQSPPKKVDRCEKLLGGEVQQVTITYQEPLPKFRSAKNTPINDHERNMLYKNAL